MLFLLFVLTLFVLTLFVLTGEIDGEHYEFVTEAEFNKMIESMQMIEFGKVGGHLYGTSRKTLRTKSDGPPRSTSFMVCMSERVCM
jgi:hypothetical protein